MMMMILVTWIWTWMVSDDVLCTKCLLGCKCVLFDTLAYDFVVFM
jgi:hypothetical protein